MYIFPCGHSGGPRLPQSCSTSPTAGWSSLPGLEEKRAILRNALSLCRFLGYERPKAAALCAAETVSPRMPETGDAAALREEGGAGETSAPAWWRAPSLWIWPPVLRRPASRATAARWRGDADILLVPSIAAGNLLGKALYGLAGGKMAGVVLGASVPIALNSRGLPGRRNITPSSSGRHVSAVILPKRRRFSCRNGCLS